MDPASVGRHIAQRALAIEATAPRLDAGMWYSDDLRDFARLQNAMMSPWSTMPGRVPTDAFERLPKRFGLYALRLRAYRSASLALRAFIHGPTVTECGNWLLALQYEALLKIMGEAAFDACFGSLDAAVPLARRLLLNHPNFGPLQSLWRDAGVSAHDMEATVQVGDLVYFAGVPDYAIKHPLGVAGGWNLVCCDAPNSGPLWIGQGIGKPCSTPAMAEHLIAAYNAPRTGMERVVAALRPFKHGMRWRKQCASVARHMRYPPGISRLWRTTPDALEAFLSREPL